jgi:CheY-like chemotaxis protein
MRVAYVEDNSTNLALVERVAGMSHHIIVSYTEGEIALRELMREKVDLILMDVELAGELSGLQVVRGLRAQGLTTPIIAVTAYAMMGDREKCMEAGCTGYLPKPLPIPELVALLNHYDELVKQQVPEVAGVTILASPSAVALPVAPSVPAAPEVFAEATKPATNVPAPEAAPSVPPAMAPSTSAPTNADVTAPAQLATPVETKPAVTEVKSSPEVSSSPGTADPVSKKTDNDVPSSASAAKEPETTNKSS